MRENTTPVSVHLAIAARRKRDSISAMRSMGWKCFSAAKICQKNICASFFGFFFCGLQDLVLFRGWRWSIHSVCPSFFIISMRNKSSLMRNTSQFETCPNFLRFLNAVTIAERDTFSSTFDQKTIRVYLPLP